ncbi:acetyltransferase [Roseivirga echinicomitans]
MSLKKIAIFGKGGFGREVHMLIEQINQFELTWEFIGFFDDSKPEGGAINGQPYLGGLSELNDFKEELCLVIAVGNPATKSAILDRILNKKITYPILIHPTVLVGNRQFVAIGEGTIICAGSIITVNIEIGKHVILNLACTVGHDTIIEDFCAFMPHVSISGEVLVRKDVYVGTGASIINQVEIGENTTVGAGSVVTKSLPKDCVAVGIPAKPIKFK